MVFQYPRGQVPLVLLPEQSLRRSVLIKYADDEEKAVKKEETKSETKVVTVMIYRKLDALTIFDFRNRLLEGSCSLPQQSVQDEDPKNSSYRRLKVETNQIYEEVCPTLTITNNWKLLNPIVTAAK